MFLFRGRLGCLLYVSSEKRFLKSLFLVKTNIYKNIDEMQILSIKCIFKYLLVCFLISLKQTSNTFEPMKFVHVHQVSVHLLY